MLDRTRGRPLPSSLAASQAANDDVEDGGDAVDDGLEDVGYAVHHGHAACADGLEDRLDLRVG